MHALKNTKKSTLSYLVIELGFRKSMMYYEDSVDLQRISDLLGFYWDTPCFLLGRFE